MRITRRKVLTTATAVGVAYLAGSGQSQPIAKAAMAPAPQKPPSNLRGHDGTVNALAFSPDGRALASAGNEGTVIVWELATGKKLHVFEVHPDTAERFERGVRAVAFSRDGKTLATGADKASLKLWDLGKGELRANLHVPTDKSVMTSVSCLAFSADGSRMISAFSSISAFNLTRGHCQAIVWDMPSGKELHALNLPGLQQYPQVAFIPPDEKRLAAACAGGRKHGISILDAETGELKADLITANCVMAEAVAVSPDGSTLASAEIGWTTQPVKVPYYQLVLWKIATGEALATSPAQVDAIRSLAFCSGGKQFVSVDGSQAMLWHAATGRKECGFGSVSRTHSVAISPDSRTLATGLENGSVQLCDLNPQARLAPPPIPR